MPQPDPSWQGQPNPNCAGSTGHAVFGPTAQALLLCCESSCGCYEVNEQNCVPIKLYLQTQEVCQMCSNKTLFTNTGRMPDVALASAGRPLIATFTSTSFKWQTKGKQMSSRPTSGNGLISWTTWNIFIWSIFIECLLCQTHILSTEDEARSKPARRAVSEGYTENLQELISP